MHAPLILFGAFDRHNFGDLLLAHVAAALLPGRQPVFAGLATRDLRASGGHEVAALSSLPLAAGDPPARLVHVGGEILTCTAWQAAVMLLPPDEAGATMAYLEKRPRERADWVRRCLATSARVPYLVSRRGHAALAQVAVFGAGGVALDRLEPRARAEVLADLALADAVSVRDGHTLAQLQAAGIAAQLTPDPAALVVRLFGARIRRRARHGEVTRVRSAFANGYIAAQFGAEFADDASAHRLAAQLDRVAARHDLGVVLFCAGTAPWHDDRSALARVAAWMRPGSARLFSSVDLWDLCALIAASRAYCGSSLHGRIVAMALALPRVNLRSPVSDSSPSKQAAYAATSDDVCRTGEVDLHDIAEAVDTAMAADGLALHRLARSLPDLVQRWFAERVVPD